MSERPFNEVRYWIQVSYNKILGCDSKSGTGGIVKHCYTSAKFFEIVQKENKSQLQTHKTQSGNILPLVWGCITETTSITLFETVRFLGFRLHPSFAFSWHFAHPSIPLYLAWLSAVFAKLVLGYKKEGDTIQARYIRSFLWSYTTCRDVLRVKGCRYVCGGFDIQWIEIWSCTSLNHQCW